MMSFFKALFASQEEFSIGKLFLEHGGYSHLHDQGKAEYEASARRLAQKQAQVNRRVKEAVAFLTTHFTKLADEQHKGVKGASPSDYNSWNVHQFEEKSSQAIRLIVRQADLRFGSLIVNQALDAFGHCYVRFRIEHNCT